MVIRVLLMAAQNEKAQKTIKWILLIIIVCIMILLSCIEAIFSFSDSDLLDMFGSEESYVSIREAVEEYGYYFNNGNGEDIIYGDWSNTDAINPEAFKRLMGEATKYIGRVYVWGGSTPATGFDCSGFVCWSYTKSGVYNLPRTTAQEIYNKCVKLPREKAVAGDLVFFTKTYPTSSPVTHIGIYIGNGRMLHCGDPIGYASIDTAYWQQHFYSFGRLP